MISGKKVLSENVIASFITKTSVATRRKRRYTYKYIYDNNVFFP